MCNSKTIEEVAQILSEQNTQDQLQTGQYFSSTIYTIKKENFLESAKKVFDEHIQKSKKDKELNKLYPVHMTGQLFDDERIKDLLTYVAETAWNIIQSQGYKMTDRATYFTEFWGQEHYEYSAMDEHVHPYGAQIVGFYFLEVPPDSSKIVIHDPRPGKVMAHMPEEDATKATDASNLINFTPDEGMLFFAPAWLPHSFTRHGSLKPLKFIHFNIGVRINDQMPAVCPAPAEVV